MTAPPRKPPHRARRGNATLVVLSFGTLLGFTALAVDLGLIRLSGTELQAALDAAALSGVGALDGTDPGITKAIDTAVAIAAANHLLGQPVSLASGDVVVGAYDRATGIFDPYVAGMDTKTVNAIRVSHAPAAIGPALGRVAFGAVGYNLDAKAMAIRPIDEGTAGSAECFLPLAVPDCHLAGLLPGTNPPPLQFTFNPTPTDSIAWGNPDANPNSAWIDSQLRDPCTGDGVEIGDGVQVNEGVHNSALQTVADLINGNIAGPTAGPWPAAYGPIPPRDGIVANLPADSAVTGPRWGNVVEGAVALVDGGIDCAAVSFTGALPTTGIGWATIYDVMDAGGNKNLWIQIDVVNPHSVWGKVDPAGTGLNVLATGEPTLEQW